jgi:hypothetical protein
MREFQEYLGKARIKPNAIIGQDHGFERWDDDSIIFDVYNFLPERKQLTTDGYGNLKKKNAYGNGSLYVKIKDLRWCEEKEYPPFPV